MTDIIDRIASEAGCKPAEARNVLELLDEGSTVPFISRYRKEKIGSLDEVGVIAVRDAAERVRELEKRREVILASLAERGVLTDELKTAVTRAGTAAELEDVYLPYRPKRRTRADIARERGLEPLAELIFDQKADPVAAAASFIDPEKDVPDVDAALAGARDIVAERVSEHAETRAALRNLFERNAVVRSAVSRGKRDAADTYRDYFEWSEPAHRAPSHRILAVLRGASEGLLTLHVLPPEEPALEILFRRFLKTDSRTAGERPAAAQMKEALTDAYRRLLGPSLETEMKTNLKQRADVEAIRVFADNLRELLLAPPLGGKAILALDPGLRTGCKLVCLDHHGALLHNETVYPLAPKNDITGAGSRIRDLVAKHRIEAIAVGNGTGGREALGFCEALALNSTDGEAIPVISVNESGASVYSASETARREFPDHDLTVRGAVSIGRRLQDPLSELVKIDPKAIGVGQYQHDVDQKALKKSLDDTVSGCVNMVGVELNTAGPELLSYVAGLSAKTAAAVVAQRSAAGGFRERKEILKVAGLGPKAFEQAAGFLRIRGGKNPLDASAVHPERYALVERMAADAGCAVAELMSDPARRDAIDPEKYVDGDVGLPTLRDILDELARPGRDPRSEFEVFRFADEVQEIGDVKEGMRLPGIVTNVTAFGAFVDIGVHQDGLIHVSELADRFVRDPREIVKPGQRVTVRVLSVEITRRRIGLSLKGV
ncbi:MAG: RNA-binding transcriptional accessory protein [Spirochaetaceae bacterium]|nr:MAG: RNA-binding transcriptional accessory protein [Spirochaetaceae bacterium]